MDQGHRAVVSHIQRTSLAHYLVSGKEEEQWFKHRPKTPVTRGFFYCHGGLVKSHLDKPTSFSELQLPALRYTCACLQKVIWSRIPALNSQNYLWSVTLPELWMEAGLQLGWLRSVYKRVVGLPPALLMSQSYLTLPAHVKTQSWPFLT